jgi:hypothetical protein
VPGGRAPGHGPVPGTTRRAAGPATPDGQLCNAWQNGKGGKPHATAFQALAAAAGGADRIPAYCAALLGAKDDKERPGQPADPGNGQGPGDDRGRHRGASRAGSPN